MLLTPLLQKKLPPESRIVIKHKVAESSDLDKLMKVLAEEIEVRERSVTTSAGSQSTARKRSTSATFIAGNHPVTCVYCQKNHQAEQCQLMTQPEARKQFLRGDGRCFVCLKKVLSAILV